jgi:hypothetical protein
MTGHFLTWGNHPKWGVRSAEWGQQEITASLA